MPTVLSYNLAHKFADFFFEDFVLLDFFTARDGNLNKDNLFTPLWVFIEKDPEALEFLGQTLGVIHAINADDNGFVFIQGSKLLYSGLDCSITYCIRESLIVNPHNVFA